VTQLDTGTDDLLAEVDDGVAVLTMNRPQRRNALSQAMLTAMDRILCELEVDDGVGCVVLTGAGGAFCAGGDVKAMAERSAAEREQTLDAVIHHQRLRQRGTSGRLWQMPKPTIAAIGGPAAGAGLSLALACDLRYAVEAAVLTTAFARVGLSGDYGGTWFLTRLVGSARARELYYFSDRLTAADAERLGILNAVFPAADFDAEIMRRARSLASGPRLAYRYMKENLNRAADGELGECMDIEATHHIHTGLTEDHREASKAFVERREPRFTGR